MILAHGTSVSHLEDIRKNGLRPRGDDKSQWDVESGSDRVYLSDAYAFYFAMNAAKAGEDLLILEVDLDEKNLLPDEDFLGAATSKTSIAKMYPDLRERTIFLRDWILGQPKKKQRELAKDSLEYLGNACFLGTIPRDKITRAALIPEKDISSIIFGEFDPIIAPINYRFMGPQYRAFQASLFERYPLELK